LKNKIYHSVTLDKEKCKGCTNCIKNCPTEAIRVRDGKARILENKCIDCGECIRICPHHAKTAVTDDFSILKKFKYNVAIPAPAFYGQFKEGTNLNEILTALRQVGFDEVFEVASAAERVTEAIRKFITTHKGVKPLISSSCPAVIRLIQVRFPELVKNIIPIKSPMEVAGKIVKEKLANKRQLKMKEIGVFFITPCPAKVTSIKSPVGSDRSYCDGAFSISQIYNKVLVNIKKLEKVEALQKASGLGIGWGRAGGENMALDIDNTLSVDGIHNVIDVLEEVEMGKLYGIDYIECQACVGGCIGGALTVENRFVSRVRLRKLAEKIAGKPDVDPEEFNLHYKQGYYTMNRKVEPKPVKLDDNVVEAIKKMDQLEKTVEELPGLDCGACGSPNCRALAEDIVRGTASDVDCVFKLRERVKALAEEMVSLSQKVPPAMGVKRGGNKEK